jgi:hypothetical protein
MIECTEELGAPLAVDLSRLHDRARTDPYIFFDAEQSWIYTDQARTLKKLGVRWTAVHDSARQRWAGEPSYRPRNLRALGGAHLPDTLDEPADPAPLAVGEGRTVRVSAELADNPTGIVVTAGQRLRLSVSPLQVWKDGKLDPCDARGWNTVEAPTADGREPKLPWKNGQQVSRSLLRGLVRPSRHRALVPEADWFELVAAIGESDFRRLNPPPAEDHADIEVTFTAWADGELRLAANDIRSRWQLLDRYGNNEGWLWVGVSRVEQLPGEPDYGADTAAAGD